jgi:hypothetical protein
MKVTYYRDQTDFEEGDGPILRFIRDLQSAKPHLFALVRETMMDVAKIDNLEKYKKTKWVKKIPKQSKPIFEFRIPPTKSGGVVRLYFGYKKRLKSEICILSCELKRGKTKADPKKLKLAEKRYSEVCI